MAASFAAGPLEVPVDAPLLFEELPPEELLVEFPALEELLLELPPGKDVTVDALLPLELVALSAELEPEPPHAASEASSAHEQQRSSIVLSISTFLSNKQRASEYYSWQRAHYGKSVSISRCVAISGHIDMSPFCDKLAELSATVPGCYCRPAATLSQHARAHQAMKYCCALIATVAVLMSGCTSPSRVLVGAPRAPIPVEQVVVYDQPPANSTDVAILNASSHSVFSPGGPSAIDKVVQRLKVQAAQLGANGLVLQGFSDKVTGSLGTGVGSDSYSRSSSVSVGAGASMGIFKKTGEALAIYVPPADR